MELALRVGPEFGGSRPPEYVPLLGGEYFPEATLDPERWSADLPNVGNGWVKTTEIRCYEFRLPANRLHDPRHPEKLSSVYIGLWRMS